MPGDKLETKGDRDRGSCEEGWLEMAGEEFGLGSSFPSAFWILVI